MAGEYCADGQSGDFTQDPRWQHVQDRIRRGNEYVTAEMHATTAYMVAQGIDDAWPGVVAQEAAVAAGVEKMMSWTQPQEGGAL
jgi:hypothetical protein